MYISARVFVFAFSLIRLIFDSFIWHLSDIQRKKPLPEEVADVYDAERYQTYLSYVADNKRVVNISKGINLVIDVFLIFSPFYSWIEAVCNGNVYLICLISYFVMWFVSSVIDVCLSYYDTFTIMEKYGLNKKDHKEFAKDEALGIISSLVISLIVYMFFAFIGEHLSVWTESGTADKKQMMLVVVGIAIIGAVLICLIQLFSYFILKKQYVFTEMEEGELKDKINALQATSKKKVKKIYIYNESKKTTTKNAFLLKLFWHREFGIADNFMDGNSEGELLAVLSHEIGHLKHKKDWRNFIGYGISILLAVVIGIFIINPTPVYALNEWVRASWNLTQNNYVVLLVVYVDILNVVMFGNRLFSSYKSKCEEYEADREAVKNGYGEEMITMFKKLSSDELVNVNPHPVVEALEYSHPGMYRRVKAIREAEGEYEKDR